ncbi:hypothetical protein TB2_000123 [Malus domestica]
MRCVGFRRFFPLSPRLIYRSSSHVFFCLTLTALSRLSLLSLAITASLFYSRHHTPRLPSRVSTHLCQNLFNFNSNGHHSSPKYSPFPTKITSQTLPISNMTCPAKHLHMIRTSSASMRTSNIDLHLCTNY